jgi:hypothetical protein
MNSDKLDMLLFTRHYLQNLDFHLTKVPNDKINRKEEKEMERTFRLKNENYSFDKKGMILRGEIIAGGQGIFVRAWDIYLDNKDIMSDDDIESCFAKGIDNKWIYFISEFEPLNTKISLSKLEYELLKYYIEHGYQYIARDDNTNLFAYDTTPSKLRSQWEVTKKVKRIYFDDLFSFIKWEDEEPYPIAYILDNCEVDENEKLDKE